MSSTRHPSQVHGLNPDNELMFYPPQTRYAQSKEEQPASTLPFLGFLYGTCSTIATTTIPLHRVVMECVS